MTDPGCRALTEQNSEILKPEKILNLPFLNLKGKLLIARVEIRFSLVVLGSPNLYVV